jgi:hypothetical protein
MTMKYDVVGKARRDYAILDNLPDNVSVLQDAAEHAVTAYHLSVETKNSFAASAITNPRQL